MRNLLCVLILLFLLSFVYAQSPKEYEINVSLRNGPKQGKAFLRYFARQGMFQDSTVITNGQFTLKGKLPAEQVVARMHVIPKGELKKSPEDECTVWLEPAKIMISSDGPLIEAKYSGSATQLQFSELQNQLILLKKQGFQLEEAYVEAEEKKDLVKKDWLLNEAYPKMFIERQKILGAFISKYPASPVSAYVFDDFAGEGPINLEVVEPVYDRLDNKNKQDARVIRVARRMDITKRTAPGMVAPDFSQTDTSGNKVSLTSFRGKYLLIDFWAGWCAPCRAENPNLRNLYASYKSKGFEILGVSLDGERPRWVNAIRDDGLNWAQVSDLKIFENEIAVMYGINSIPQNILIDPEGKIIAWNLRGNSLNKKMEEIFR